MSSPEEILQNALAAHFAGQLTAAEVGYHRVLRLHPANAQALHGLGVIHFSAGARDQGIDCLLRSVQASPAFGPAWNTLGSMYMETDKPFEAKLAYQRATEVAPELSEAWFNLAICAKHEQDMESMVAHLRRAIACPRVFLLAYERLATTLNELGRQQESAQTVTEWLTRDPTNATAQRMAAARAAAEVLSSKSG
jgi:tetratricopeptide (TPR) repeat protein